MSPRWLKAFLFSSLILSTILACGLPSLGFLTPSASQGPIQLLQCNAYPSALCLQSFGLGQNQLVVSFYFPEAGAVEYHLKIWQAGEATNYSCAFTTVSSIILYCMGPLIPLGTPIRVELYTKLGSLPLAEGDFTLTALALPTFSIGAVSETPGVTTTPAATGYPNPNTPQP